MYFIPTHANTYFLHRTNLSKLCFRAIRGLKTKEDKKKQDENVDRGSFDRMFCWREISNTSSQSDLHKQLKTNPSRLNHPQIYFSETQKIKQPLHSELFNKHRQGQGTHRAKTKLESLFKPLKCLCLYSAIPSKTPALSLLICMTAI